MLLLWLGTILFYMILRYISLWYTAVCDERLQDLVPTREAMGDLMRDAHMLVVPEDVRLSKQLLILEEFLVVFLTYFLLRLDLMEEWALRLPTLPELDEAGAVLVGAVRGINARLAQKKIIYCLT